MAQLQNERRRSGLPETKTEPEDDSSAPRERLGQSPETVFFQNRCLSSKGVTYGKRTSGPQML